MPTTLRLEDHVFRIAEGQMAMAEYLDAASGGAWDWQADMQAGTLSFVSRRKGSVLASGPIRLIGSTSTADGTWMWGWANASLPQDAGLFEGFDAVRAQAAAESRDEFLSAEAFPLERPGRSQEIAITVAGFLGAFTYYAGGYGGGSVFFALPTFAPLAGNASGDVLRKTTVIGATLSSPLSFDQRSALYAYLGEPTTVEGDAVTFDIDGTPLTVTFDGQGRIADLGMTLKPPQRERRGGGLFGRLFGRK
jgi:hypothetical protein